VIEWLPREEEPMNVGQGWERVDWDSAEMHPGVAGGWFLVVRGVTPVLTDLEPHSLPIPIAPEELIGKTKHERGLPEGE
jgi:hypothetical protein